MNIVGRNRSKLFAKGKSIIKSEAFPGVMLLVATLIALIIANGPLSSTYNEMLHHTYILPGFSLHAFINDFLMAIFFLVVGCEIKREVVEGHLSNVKKASFPIVAAFGGVIVPAIIFFILNRNTQFMEGLGVPISTDIAFAIGAFILFKDKLNSSLKVFLLTLAVVDDLISIIIIGVFYSSHINIGALIIAVAIILMLLLVKKYNNKNRLYPYIVLGLALWFFVYKSGIHATISGVILAMLIPIAKGSDKKEYCLNERVEHLFSSLSSFIILPLFAFANTGISLNINSSMVESKALIAGIVIGLVIGKPLGIMLFTYVGTKMNFLEKPKGVLWFDVLCVAMLAGIGFTMSIFVSEIAFAGNTLILDIAKISILIAAVLSCLLALLATTYASKLKNKVIQ